LPELTSTTIAERSSAARELEESGKPEHLPQLVSMAVGDRSPGVRLHCAAAAKAILSRNRYTLHDELRESLLKTVLAVDPVINPGLFQIVAELGLPSGRARLLNGMRDPRVDVRTGAAVGLLSYCAQGRCCGDEELEKAVVGLLADARLKPDVKLEVVRICAQTGFKSALPAAEMLAAGSEKTAAALTESINRLQDSDCSGIWTDTGMDTGVAESRVKRGESIAIVNKMIVSALGERPLGPVRKLWLKEGGESGPLLQLEEKTWALSDSDELESFVSQLSDPQSALQLPWPDSAAGRRAQAVLLLKLGKAEEALEKLLEAAELKRVPVDVWWLLGDTLGFLQRDEEARPYLEKYISKSGKKGEHIAEARRRLGEEPGV
jgi:hypothetical protein